MTNELSTLSDATSGASPSRDRPGTGRVIAQWAFPALLILCCWWYSPPAQPSFRLCPFLWLTGKLCPLCGLTRAFCALAKGHWTQAIQFHALSPLAAVMVGTLGWNFRGKGQWLIAGSSLIAMYGAWRIVAF